MRFMILVKASAQSEAGLMPTEAELLEMGRFNEALIQSGVMLAGDGLHPTVKGARLRYAQDGAMQVIDGPFAESKELIAGYWILEAESQAEVIERFRSCPAGVGELEVRQLFEAADFAPAVSTEEGQALLAARDSFRHRPA